MKRSRKFIFLAAELNLASAIVLTLSLDIEHESWYITLAMIGYCILASLLMRFVDRKLKEA